MDWAMDWAMKDRRKRRVGTGPALGWVVSLGLAVLGCRADAPPPAGGADAPEAGRSAAAAPEEDPPAPPADPPAEAAPEPEAGSAPEAPAADASAPDEATLANAAGPADPLEPLEDPPAVEPSGPRKVLILGDSLAATGIGALLERKLDARSDVVCYRKGKSASGLARPDFYDWPREAKRQVEFRDPDLVVVILGGNDGQDLTPARKGPRFKWHEEGWDAEYRRRMEAFLDVVGGPGRKVLWLGLPTMGLRSLEKKMTLIRPIQQEAVEDLAPEAIYLDTTPFVSDADGAMLREAPVGASGKVEALRAEDRIHFTMPGSEYFADHVLPAVLSALDLPETPPDAPEGGAKP